MTIRTPEQLLRDHGVEIALDDHRPAIEIARAMADLGIINSHLVLLTEHALVNNNYHNIQIPHQTSYTLVNREEIGYNDDNE